ncbi:hypothetical protein IP87_03650 [beta proteobacterium AAP121]|nr:hypothetical protein IP80_16935 [beta proteobacterium AAP65]KPG00138.1 hypothetical protein IP87_03650 [beta proteobacterium AAP121]
MRTRSAAIDTKDLRGAARLATDGVAGLTSLVEAMHERIAKLPGTPGALQGRTTGITGLVYRSVRGVTRLAGGTVEALLGLITPPLSGDTPAALPSPDREALVAALNGVLGDHLAATGNPLAIAMALRHGGQALPLQAPALAAWLQARAAPPPATVLVLLHGLCMNDLQWRRADGTPDLGTALAAPLGALPLYLHANTGLPIADNGHQFAALMQQLVAAWPVPVQRVVLIGHSMGGLIARSALHEAAGEAWAALCSDLVCLGSPHHGAPLEKAGYGVDLLLGATPGLARYTAPLARLGKLRSAGITDLRHGLQDAAGRARPLPTGPRCWAIAGTLDASLEPGATRGRARLAFSRLRGDGLVPVASALGQHSTVAQRLAFAPGHTVVLPATGHLALMHSPAVLQQLQAWLAPGPR